MPRINLLPWREERRQELQRQFISMAVGVGILGAVLIWFAHIQVEALKDYHHARNAFIEQQIAEMKKKIKEIDELAKKRRNLIKRMEAIEKLQGSRPLIVHLFEELAFTMPDGVYLKNLKYNGEQLTLDGVAQSNARVSVYMRQLDDSDWLKGPALSVIQTQGDGVNRKYNFNLSVKQDEPKVEGKAKGAGS